MQDLGVRKAPTQISEGLGDQALCPEMPVCETACEADVEVKKTLESWRIQECGLSEETYKEGAELSQAKEALGAAITRNGKRAEVSNPFGAHILPRTALDAAQDITGLNVHSAGFWTCFNPIPLHPPVCILWSGNVGKCLILHLHWGL